jgi:antitoxin component YwqK of YwqJK toxin-antitoxin module
MNALKHIGCLMSFVILMVQNGISQPNDTCFFNASLEKVKSMEQGLLKGIPLKLSTHFYKVELYDYENHLFATCHYKSASLILLNGPFIKYAPFGNIEINAAFKNHRLHGNYQRWWKKGIKSDSGNMNRGMMVGTWKTWYEKGALFEIKNYSKGRDRMGKMYSQLSGTYTSYHPNGHTKDSGNYILDKKEYDWVEWIEGGKIKSMGPYKDDRKKGDWKYFNSQGKLLYIRRFRKMKDNDQGELIPVSN